MSRLSSPALALVVSASALATAACGAAPTSGGSGASSSARTVSITHAQGTTTVPHRPSRVAVLDLGVLDSLQSIDAATSVAAVTKQGMPSFLDGFQDPRYVDLGSMKEPDVEALAVAKPDLILVGARGASKYAELSRIAPTLDLTVSTKGDLLTNAKKVNTQLGQIFGKEAEVAAKHRVLDAKVTSTRAKAAAAGTGLILMTSGGKVSAFGPSSRFGLIHTALGVRPTGVAISEDRHGQAASFEYIKAAAPGRIFVVDRDAAIGEHGKPAAKVLDNALVRSTPAGAQGRITALDGQRWYVTGAGLDNLATMVDEVARGL